MPEPLIFKHLREESPNPRQQEFFMATARHVGYGGARGGGKSWAMRRKLVMLAMRYDGLKLLLLRRTYGELNENHILPLRAELYGYAKYSSEEKAFTFPNGSRIKLGYCDAEADVLQYQGQEYDVIGLEEATGFTENQRTNLTLSCRTTRTDFTPRMYYTTNPGGVGHQWFKRLFIDRDYRGRERPEDHVFIPATVYDNAVLMRSNPEYVEALENLPEDMRRAYLLGDWDVFAGQYFTEFDRKVHVVKPFDIPSHWRRYLTIDYGLDMLAAYWIAVDEQGRAFVYKECYRPGLTISAASEALHETGRLYRESGGTAHSGEDELYAQLAPPDLFNRRQETGRSAVDIFSEDGWVFTKSCNDRVQGWYDLKEWLRPVADEQGNRTARLVIFEGRCPNLVRTLPLLQHDGADPNDVAREPHELTHAADALRGFAAGRPVAADGPRSTRAEWEDDQWEDYWSGSEEQKARMIERWGNPF